MQAKDKLIVALDVVDLTEAKHLVKQLLPYCAMFKIGSVLSNAVGTPQTIEMVHKLGGKVFFDEKFHDIPNTMASTVKQISALGVEMFTVHAQAGGEAMRASAKAKSSSKMIAVTILTSFSDEQCLSLYGRTLINKINDLAELAQRNGADGLVCAPTDISHIETKNRQNMLLICPGIRPKWAEPGDQYRIITPSIALSCGADFLVIGRPIISPPAEIGAPEKAAQLILQEMQESLERR